MLTPALRQAALHTRSLHVQGDVAKAIAHNVANGATVQLSGAYSTALEAYSILKKTCVMWVLVCRYFFTYVTVHAGAGRWFIFARELTSTMKFMLSL